MKTVAAASCAIGFLVAALVNAGAAPAKSSPEDRYVASRDAAIKKLKPLYDAGKMDDAGTKIEDAARADLEAQLRVILGPLDYAGFGPGKLNLNSLYEGDEGYGTLDGLRFDANVGDTGEPAGSKPDGTYVEPKAHIIVTTQTMFARWLRAHKDWWDKGVKNVPQQIGAALRDESFYTQAISTGAAVINFNELPVARPASATLAYAMLAGHTQSEIPDTADEVFVAALANGKAYVAFSSIAPKVADSGLQRDPGRLQQKVRGRGRSLSAETYRHESIRQARQPPPTRRRRVQALLHRARAEAVGLRGGDKAGAGIVGKGGGEIAAASRSWRNRSCPVVKAAPRPGI